MTDSAVARVAAVLQALAGEEDRTGAEIARVVGRERSQVSRMLKSLVATGLVEQDPETRAYRLGWQLYALTARAGDQRLLRRGAPVLRALALETGESVLLSVLQGNRSFTVLRERSSRTVQAGGWVGRTSPLHLSASGRALLFDEDDAAIRELIRADVDGAAAEKVLDRIRRERQQGAAVAADELEIGLTSVGVPVRDGTNRVVAALNVSGPSDRMRDRVATHSAAAQSAARRILQTSVTRVLPGV
jgi:IclR family acetate operon transcriptional repressor